MKQQSGKNIAVVGSPTLARTMLQSDLLDTFRVWVHPVVVGRGKRLFMDGDDLKRLKLVDTKSTRSGVAILTYQPG
jgi:dihydrofolate reductase